MIPVASTLTEVDHLPGEEVEFSIADARWVMRSLADLYSDRELACIREYSTNARDAMVEAGKADKPIKVSLPTILNPYFTIQDFGVGMSETELKEVYTKFGDSTKRDSNEFNGMLGFGSKSAVAYTNTFTVTAVKDGWKTIGVVTRKEDYSIVLKVVMTTATDEGNGVTVQIPVSNSQMFAQKARDFYRFWKPGTVEVDGQQPEWTVGEKLADDLFYSPSSGTSYVVMGNVAYRIANPDALFPMGMNRISFVAYVPNGAVEFTPNREDLKYSDHTKDALKKIIDNFVATTIAAAKAELAKAKDHAEAYQIWSKWKGVIGANVMGTLTFKGDALTDTFAINASRYHIRSARNSTYRIANWTVSNMGTTVIVTGFNLALGSHHKARVREWIAKKNLTAFYVLFTDADKVNSPWVDTSRVVSWEQVKADTPVPKKPKVANSAAYGRKAGTFDTIGKDGWHYEQDVPQTKNLYWIPLQEYRKAEQRTSRAGIIRVCQLLNLGDDVVIVPANRVNKFMRNYPHAQAFLPMVLSKTNLDGPSLLSKDAVTFLETTEADRRLLNLIDVNKVADPEIRDMVTLFKKKEADLLEDYHKHQSMAAVCGKVFKQHNYNYWNAKKMPVTGKYPLLSHHALTNAPVHAYEYMNAIFKARKDGKNV